MENANPKENKLLASIWFVLAICIGVSAIAALFGQGPFLSLVLICIGLMSGAFLLFIIGKQRLARYRLESGNFKRAIAVIGFIAMGFCIFGSILYSKV